MRLSVVKQSFFGPPGQYGRLVTRANYFGPVEVSGFFLASAGYGGKSSGVNNCEHHISLNLIFVTVTYRTLMALLPRVYYSPEHPED